MVTFLLLRTHGLKLEKQSGTSVPLTARLSHYIRKLLLPICSQQRVSVRKRVEGKKKKGGKEKKGREGKRREKRKEKKGKEREKRKKGEKKKGMRDRGKKKNMRILR
jgi:hypothetical protein